MLCIHAKRLQLIWPRILVVVHVYFGEHRKETAIQVKNVPYICLPLQIHDCQHILWDLHTWNIFIK
jgi:hypothetical protein